VHRLEDKYDDKVMFFHLDVDMPAEDEARQKVGITGRSQYYLLDSNGEIAARWFGPITFEEVSAEIDMLLSQ
jgi:hypothetical protein